MNKRVNAGPGVVLAYEDDCFVEPWRSHETLLLVHGIAESSRAWIRWVPPLAAEFRVLRVDLPGLGDSTAPPDYDWSLKRVVADLHAFLDALGIAKVHLVAAKFGGCIAMQFAADYPSRVSSLAVFGSPFQGRSDNNDLGAESDRIKAMGTRAWAAAGQQRRLGSEASQAQVRWWTEELMGKADVRACAGYAATTGTTDLADTVGKIKAPTLVVTTAQSSMQSVSTAERFTNLIADAELVVLPGDLYHLAAVRPNECTALLLRFLTGRARPRRLETERSKPRGVVT